MPHRIEIELDGKWTQVEGALLHIRAFEFRAIVTSDLELLGSRNLDTVRVRVDGRLAEQIRWSVVPDRGYASCEMRLPIDENPTSG